MNNYDIALKIVQGQTVNRKDIEDIKNLIEILKSFRGNCNLVIRQLKEVEG